MKVLSVVKEDVAFVGVPQTINELRICSSRNWRRQNETDGKD